MSINLTASELEFRQQENNRLEVIYKKERKYNYVKRKRESLEAACKRFEAKFANLKWKV